MVQPRAGGRVLAVVAVVLKAAVLVAARPEAPTSPGDALVHPRPDLEPFPNDFYKPYDGVQFGPMGPARRDGTPNDWGDRDAAAARSAASTEDSRAANDSEDIRYPVASVSFQRVRTPFIIGLWIFCASLAKIGKPIKG